MYLAKVVSVDIDGPEEAILGCSIDVPRVGAAVELRAIDIMGWAVGRERRATGVEVISDGSVLAWSPIDIVRSDVAAHFGREELKTCGFEASVALFVDDLRRLDIWVMLERGLRVPIGSITLAPCERESEGRRTPLVSVVIPCYNQARFLSESIESVLAQTYPRVEAVVIDDGSTDNTVTVAARYPGVRYVRQENKGLAEARNTGIRHSSGEFLLFLDCDDRLTPDGVAAGMRCFDENPPAAMVSGRYRAVSVEGQPLWEGQRDPKQASSYAGILPAGGIIPPAAALFRRDAFEAVGVFDRTVDATADHEIFLRVARRFPVAAHDTVVVEYRQHGTNMSRNPELMLAHFHAVLRAQRPFIGDDRAVADAFRDAWVRAKGEFADRVIRAVRERVRRREFRLAIRGAAAVLRFHPRLSGRLLMLVFADLMNHPAGDRRTMPE